MQKDRNSISQILTLATSTSIGQLEQDGEGISSKKILKKGNRIQNYIFKLINRATVDESNLTRDTVANISNEGTKTFISTDNKDFVGSEDEFEEQEDKDVENDTEDGAE